MRTNATRDASRFSSLLFLTKTGRARAKIRATSNFSVHWGARAMVAVLCWWLSNGVNSRGVVMVTARELAEEKQRWTDPQGQVQTQLNGREQLISQTKKPRPGHLRPDRNPHLCESASLHVNFPGTPSSAGRGACHLWTSLSTPPVQICFPKTLPRRGPWVPGRWCRLFTPPRFSGHLTDRRRLHALRGTIVGSRSWRE